MEAYSTDLRRKVLAAWDAGEGTQAELARRFKVSVRWIAKLIAQRRTEGTIAPKQRGGRRPPAFDAEARRRLAAHVRQHPDQTLEQLRQWAQQTLGIHASIMAVDRALRKEKITFKKRRSRAASRRGRTSRSSARRGGAPSPRSIRAGSCSSMNPGRKRT